jgi:hypothetical protein
MTGLCLALAENHIHIASFLVGHPVDVTLGALGAAIYHVKSWEALKLMTATYFDTSSNKNAAINPSSLPSSAAAALPGGLINSPHLDVCSVAYLLRLGADREIPFPEHKQMMSAQKLDEARTNMRYYKSLGVF